MLEFIPEALVEFLGKQASDPCSEQETREELDRLLSSREFANAERLCRFLSFVVDRTLAGDRDSLKESVIGSEVYGRAHGYNPKAEPIVRTEARRLRAKLADYYQNGGRDARVRISIPTGGYVAVFEYRQQPSPPLDPIPRPMPMEPDFQPAPASQHRTGSRWRLGAAAAVLCVIAAGVFLLRRAGDSRNISDYVLTTVTSFPGMQNTPAISPDGRQVVFAWSQGRTGADLYLVGADGGTPRQLTTAHAADTLPAWSPDGTQIAFIRADNLIVVSPFGGGERTFGPAFPSWLSWSPNGSALLVSDWDRDRKELALFSIDGTTGARKQITFPPAGITGDTSGALAPDGSRMAFIRCNLGNCDIYTATYGRTEVQRLTHDECAFAGLTWMPDGRSVVYSSRRHGPFTLWQVNASGGIPEQLPSSSDDAHSPRAVRSSSGKVRIVFDHRTRNGNLWRQSLHSEGAHAVSPNSAERLMASTRLDSSPQISPDGKRIVFVSDRNGYDEIWAADADGANQRVLTHLRQTAGSPRWSPDSSRVAFDLLTKNGRAIFLTDANGSTPRQWTAWGDAARPSWSRDGRWIYFGSHDRAGTWQVWKISTAPDRTAVQVTRDGGFEAFESPDGRTLYYTAGSELRRMPASGGPWTRVTNRPVRDGWWSVADNGIYFADLPEPKSTIYDEPFPVLLLNPLSGAIREAASIKGPVIRSTPDFAVSADGRTLLYCVLEGSTSQIRLLEAL